MARLVPGQKPLGLKGLGGISEISDFSLGNGFFMTNKAITYNRGSTDMQEASIPAQKKEAERYAKEHNLEIIRHFDDDGWSGRNAEERPAFMEMMEYARTHDDFKYIIVYDVSRWGRFESPKEATYWEVLCEKTGKKIKYSTESNVNDDSMGAFITKVIKDSEASEYSKKLSKVSFRGHKHYAELGYHVGGGKKYGYNRLLLDERGNPVKVLADGEHKATKLQRVKLVKGDPDQVKTIQRIYDMYVNKGHGIGNICNVLNSEGIPSPRNKGWGKSTIWTILHDETYMGCLVWNRYVCKNYHEKGNGWIKYKPESEWVIKAGAHDPIIEEALFKAVQAKTRQAFKGGFRFKGKGRGYHTPYLLSGIIKCIECESNYQGRVATSRKEKKTYETRYYLCGNFAMKDGCKKLNVSKDLVEDFAVKEISRRVRNPFWIQTIKERLEKKIGVIKKNSSKNVEKIEVELKDVQTRIANIVKAIEEGSDKDILGDRLSELKAKRDRLCNMKAQGNREMGK